MLFAVLPAVKKASSTNNVAGAVLRIVLRFFQFVMALTVVGLYGVDLHNAHKAGDPADSRWVFAEVVAGISAITVLVYGIPMVKSFYAFWLDILIFLLWIVVFGIFGKIYVGASTEDNSRVVRMKHAVYVDAVNMILWCLSAGYMALLFFRRKESGGEKNRAEV